MSLTRSLKFEVVFPGLRAENRSVVYRRVWGVMDDLTRAANKLISSLYSVKIGMTPHPLRADGTKIPFQSLPYSACKAEPDWLPGGAPGYVVGKDNWRAGGGVISALGEFITGRLATDFKDIQRGNKSLSTFRTLPIPIRAQEITYRADGSFELSIFAKEHKKSRVTIRPRKLDGGQKTILDRIAAGTLKMGAGKLIWSKTRRKWLFSLSWTDEKHELIPIEEPPAPGKEPLVAGVDLGIVNAAWIVFTKLDGTPVKKPHVVSFPRRVFRAVARLAVERKERSYFNRADLGLRSGRGVSRKLRVTDSLGAKVYDLNDAMLRQIASLIVKECVRRGATLLVLENLTHWSVEKMNAEAYDASTKGEGARIRQRYFKLHQGALRKYVREFAERERLSTLEVNPAFTSRTCSACGIVHKRDWVRNPPKEGEVAYGRISQSVFRCSCGATFNADYNAGLNIARRGIAVRLSEAS